MAKRIMLALTCVAAFSLAGAGLTNTAEAQRVWVGPRYHTGYYYGSPRVSYRSGFYRPRTVYRPFYGPRYGSYWEAPRYGVGPRYGYGYRGGRGWGGRGIGVGIRF